MKSEVHLDMSESEQKLVLQSSNGPFPQKYSIRGNYLITKLYFLISLHVDLILTLKGAFLSRHPRSATLTV